MSNEIELSYKIDPMLISIQIINIEYYKIILQNS